MTIFPKFKNIRISGTIARTQISKESSISEERIYILELLGNSGIPYQEKLSETFVLNFHIKFKFIYHI